MKLPGALSVILLVSSSAVNAGPAKDSMTAEAVEAADDGWMDAEIRGDGEYIADLLLDGYVSVAASGKMATKQDIIASAMRHGKSEQFARQVAEWRAAHPSNASVAIFGDTAVLTWTSIEPNSPTPIHSCDVFVYREGRWHAIYSQHTTATD